MNESREERVPIVGRTGIKNSIDVIE